MVDFIEFRKSLTWLGLHVILWVVMHNIFHSIEESDRRNCSENNPAREFISNKAPRDLKMPTGVYMDKFIARNAEKKLDAK